MNAAGDPPIADLIRIALARIRIGDDIGSVLHTLAIEAYERGQRGRDLWDEATPVRDLWQRGTPSQRPTARPPSGTFSKKRKR